MDLDGIPGTRVTGHPSPGTLVPGHFIFYFYFIFHFLFFYLGGSSFFAEKKICFFSPSPSLSLFLCTHSFHRLDPQNPISNNESVHQLLETRRSLFLKLSPKK